MKRISSRGDARGCLLAVLLSIALLVSHGALAGPASAASCGFALGFKVIHDALPEIVGDCLVNEHFNPQNGDSVQETTGTRTDGAYGGLLVWRKADNWTAYTDGYRTWVNGPNGIQQRLNTERFPWEAQQEQSTARGSQPAVQTRRLETGTFIRDARRTRLGELNIENGRDQDAVAVLATADQSTVIAVYVRARESFKINGIRDNTYSFYFMTGEDWDGDSARFTRNTRLFRFDDPVIFQTTDVPDGRRYLVMRVTLHSVPGGTATTRPVASEEFPRLGLDNNQSNEAAPRNARDYLNSGNAYAERGEYQKAIGDYDRAIALDPGNPQVPNNRGRAYFALRDYQKARDDYDRAIAQDPDYALAYFNRGLANSRLGEHHKAIGDYERAIELDPKFVAAVANIGWEYYLLHEYDLSIRASRRALEIDPSRPLIRFNLALALLAKGANDEAKAEYLRGIGTSTSVRDIDAGITDLRQLIRQRPELSSTAESVLRMLEEARATRFGQPI